jgi:ParB family chromosome partitioning protein
VNTPPPSKAKPALGRGLAALLPTPAAPAAGAAATPAGRIDLVPIAAIQPNPLQPRRHFDPAALAELAASIRTQGVLQPVLVRPLASGYELVAGERRLRAAQQAGLTHLPALIRPAGDEPAFAWALVENLQRQDLNPIEQAEAFQQLAQRFRLTQEQIGAATGKDRASIANAIRLLRLDPEVVARVRDGRLTPGQARPLLALDPERQRALAERIEREQWPARRVEAHLQRTLEPPAAAAPKPRDPNLRDAELQLSRALGAKVQLRANRRHRGSITIAFHDLDEFQRLFERFVGPQG